MRKPHSKLEHKVHEDMGFCLLRLLPFPQSLRWVSTWFSYLTFEQITTFDLLESRDPKSSLFRRYFDYSLNSSGTTGSSFLLIMVWIPFNSGLLSSRNGSVWLLSS